MREKKYNIVQSELIIPGNVAMSGTTLHYGFKTFQQALGYVQVVAAEAYDHGWDYVSGQGTYRIVMQREGLGVETLIISIADCYVQL